MRSGMYYLNNSGSRWVVLENGKRIKETFKTVNGELVTRRIIEYYSFGNFVGAIISYKGKKQRVLLDEILND